MHRLTRLSLAHPKITLLILAAITIVLGAGLPRVRPEYGYRVLVGDEHPSIRALDSLIANFGGGLPALIAWECGEGMPCKSVFDSVSLSMADALTRELEKSPAVMDVTGPSNAPLLVPTSDGFSSRRFVEHGKRAADADALALRALDDPLWIDHLVSEDGRTGVIVVQTTDTQSDTNLALVETLEEAVAPHEIEGFRFYLSGNAVAAVISSRDLSASTARLIPFTVLVIGLVVLFLSRSLPQTVLALATMGLGLLWTVGLMGWLDWPQDSIHEVLAPLILVVGICDAIHVLARYAVECRRRASPSTPEERSAIFDFVAQDVGLGCLITTLTTAGAFLSFTSSSIDTFVRFGAIAAFGVTACLILTFTLLPVVAIYLPVGATRTERLAGVWEAALGAVLRICARRAGPILLVSLVLIAICGFGWARYLRVDTDWIESWGEQSFVAESIEFLEDRIAPATSLELQLELPPGTSLEAPAALAHVEALSNELSSIEGLGKTESVLDLLRRLNRLVHDDDPAFERVGDTAAANAELLELISLEDSTVLRTWLSLDRSRLRISTQTSVLPYLEGVQILESVNRAVGLNLPTDWNVVVSGNLAIDRDWLRDVQATQIRSFPIAFAIVFVLVGVFLRSWRLALAAMVPTTLPIVVTLGTMGWLGLSLDVGRAMIAAVLLGIAVDDSIHILRRYQLARQEGARPDEAIRRAVLHTGRAVTTTSLALSLGFLTLMASSWQSIASFGFFVALAILGALVATLFVLPALIFAFTRSEPEELSNSAVPGVGSQPAPGVARKLGSLLILLPVGASLVGAGLLATRNDATREFPCWVLPQGQVIALALPGAGDCPLHFLDEIRSLEEVPSGDASSVLVTVSRAGELQSVRVPLLETTPAARAARWTSAALVACALLGLPLFLLWRSSSAVAGPLGFFYTAIAVLCVTGIAGHESVWMNRAAMLAYLIAPAALTHLSFVFPERERVMARAPRLALLPYLGSLFAAAAGFAVMRNPVLWPAFIYLLLALSTAACALLLASCYFALRESESQLERAQARAVFFGALALPVAPALFVASNTGTAAATATYLCVFSLAMPLPLGLAISRYNLFDLGWDARRALARFLYFGAGALLSAGVLYLILSVAGVSLGVRELGFLFAASMACLLLGELLRRPTLGSLQALLDPRREVLRAARQRYSGAIGQLRDEDAVADLVAGVLRDGLAARAGCVFLCRSGHWRPAAVFGPEPPVLLSLVATAEELLGDRVMVHLLREPDLRSRPLRLLESEGVEVVAALESADTRLGLVLLSSRERHARAPVPFAGAELDFVALTCAQAGIALHNAQLAEEGVVAERQAATGRMAVTLIHDLGKDLGWIRMLMKRMARKSTSDPMVAERYKQLWELAESVQARMQTFLRDATQPRRDPPGVVPVDDLLSRVVRRVVARRGDLQEEQLRLSVDPAVRQEGCHETLGEVVTNLIENALQASPAGQPITVSATTAGSRGLEIAVEDRGRGIDSHELEAVFELGYTTESGRGGSGIGLAVSRDIVESLGGKLALSARNGGGTRAAIQVPCVSAGTPGSPGSPESPGSTEPPGSLGSQL